MACGVFQLIYRIILFFIFLLKLYGFAQIKSYNVITRDELKYISVIKLSDIFQLMPQLNLYSTDGYRFRPNPGRDLTNSKNDMHIFINGTKVFHGLSEVFNINHLPIHPEQIDSIIILNGSLFYKNEYLQGIILDFILKENKNDYSFYFTHSSGNEIGDPGPYIYTEYASENVDQVGPNTQAFFGYRSGDYSLNINYLDRVFPATDSKILARVPKFVFENYQIRFFGASLDFSTKSLLGNHYVFTSFTKTGQAVTGFVYGSDLIFMENISREIPVETSAFSLSTGNKVELSENSSLNLDLNTGINSFLNSKYMPLPEFDNLEKWFNSKILFNHSFEKLNLRAGMQYLFNDIKDRTSSFQVTHNLFSLNSEATFSLIKNFYQNISVNADLYSNQSLYRLQFYNHYDFEQSSLSIKLFTGTKTNTFSNILIPLETELPFDFFYLPKFHQVEIGYQYKPKQDCIINIEAAIERETHLHIRLGSFRHLNMVNILLQDMVYEEKGLNLTKADLNISIEDKLSKTISHRFFYNIQKVFSYDYLVTEFYRRIPSYRFNYSISFFPSNDLTLSANVNYQGETEWFEYKQINANTNPIKEPIYTNKLRSSVLLNVTVTKTFWKDRIRINTSIYNLLNNEIQYHPLGGVMRLIFYLKGEIAI